jgi:ABC-type Fe3+-hydroxamate transport system substrate-binding protein
MRIVSLVPSLTELLFDLGLEDHVVGVTKFCIHPPEAKPTRTLIGGTKNPSVERILQLQPDLVIANREENRKEDVARLEPHTQVLVTDISTIDDALSAILQIGSATGAVQAADSIVHEIGTLQERLREQKALTPLLTPPKILYLIWQNPYMSVGSDTFIHAMISELGAESVTQTLRRYPEITEADIHELAPNEIWLSDEPFPFGPDHVLAFQKLFPFARVRLVSGEVYSWYGSRMILAYHELLKQYAHWAS